MISNVNYNHPGLTIEISSSTKSLHKRSVTFSPTYSLRVIHSIDPHIFTVIFDYLRKDLAKYNKTTYDKLTLHIQHVFKHQGTIEEFSEDGIDVPPILRAITEKSQEGDSDFLLMDVASVKR